MGANRPFTCYSHDECLNYRPVDRRLQWLPWFSWVMMSYGVGLGGQLERVQWLWVLAPGSSRLAALVRSGEPVRGASGSYGLHTSLEAAIGATPEDPYWPGSDQGGQRDRLIALRGRHHCRSTTSSLGARGEWRIELELSIGVHLVRTRRCGVVSGGRLALLTAGLAGWEASHATGPSLPLVVAAPRAKKGSAHGTGDWGNSAETEETGVEVCVEKNMARLWDEGMGVTQCATFDPLMISQQWFR